MALLWRSERGGDGVTPEGVAFVADHLPTRPDFRTATKAAHFAFLPPCPPALPSAIPETCSGATGFDRAEFHRQLGESVIEFFEKTLPGD